MIKHVDIYTAVLSEKNLCLYITASLSFALLITQNKSQRHASPLEGWYVLDSTWSLRD